MYRDSVHKLEESCNVCLVEGGGFGCKISQIAYGHFFSGHACLLHVETLPTIYRIAGNFRGSKLLQIGRKGAFHGQNFHRMLN